MHRVTIMYFMLVSLMCLRLVFSVNVILLVRLLSEIRFQVYCKHMNPIIYPSIIANSAAVVAQFIRENMFTTFPRYLYKLI